MKYYNMQVATHNSFSYGTPYRLWMWPFKYFAQCQDLNIYEQLRRGVRIFDARLVIKPCNNFKDYEVFFGHGIVTYKDDVWFTFKYIDDYAKDHKVTVYVRVLLERGSEESFENYVNSITKRFTHINFIGGQRKKDWKKVVDLPGYPVELMERYAAMPSEKKSAFSKINNLFPKLYAKRHNLQSYYEYMSNPANEKKVLMLDFIEIGYYE